MEIHLHIHHYNESQNIKLNKIMSALTDLKDLAARQGAAIQCVRADIARLKEIIANNPDGINSEGVEELKTLFGANAQALEELDAETTDATPGGETPTP